MNDDNNHININIDDNNAENENFKVDKEENIINKGKGNATNGKKIFSMLSKGFKKTMSPDYDSSVYAVNRIKARSYDLYSNLRDFFYVIWMIFSIVFYYIIGAFKLLKIAPHAFSMAAKNNFRIGINMLEKNNLVDARIRFLLSNLFYNKSTTTKYYIAFVYYKQNNIKKSLKYLKQAINLNPSHERSIELLKEIEKSLENREDKIIL